MVEDTTRLLEELEALQQGIRSRLQSIRAAVEGARAGGAVEQGADGTPRRDRASEGGAAVDPSRGCGDGPADAREKRGCGGGCGEGSGAEERGCGGGCGEGSGGCGCGSKCGCGSGGGCGCGCSSSCGCGCGSKCGCGCGCGSGGGCGCGCSSNCGCGSGCRCREGRGRGSKRGCGTSAGRRDGCGGECDECDECGDECTGDCDECDECDESDADGELGTALTLRADLGPVDVAQVQSGADVARYIDHTLLKPDATRAEVLALCDEAVKHGFASVCVSASNVALAATALADSKSKVIAVVGFPLGATLPGVKAFEAREAARRGAKEIDTVLNVGALKSKDYGLVLRDVRAVVRAVEPLPVKVILETALLSQDEKIIACGLAKAAGAHFVKTCTGFGGGGATVEDVALMRRVVGDDVGVKASGGVRSFDDARRLLEAGASRLGASASVAIATGAVGSAKY